jgi:hypothetical protein
MHSLNSPLDLNLKTSENPVWCLGGIPNDMREGFFGYARGGWRKWKEERDAFWVTVQISGRVRPRLRNIPHSKTSPNWSPC